MKKIIIGFCLCLPSLIFAANITNYNTLKAAIVNKDSIIMTFNINKINGAYKASRSLDFLPNTFSKPIIKKNGNIVFNKDYVRANLTSTIPIIHSVEYIFKQDGGVIIIGSDSNSFTHAKLITYKEKTKLGNGVYLQAKKS